MIHLTVPFMIDSNSQIPLSSTLKFVTPTDDAAIFLVPLTVSAYCYITSSQILGRVFQKSLHAWCIVAVYPELAGLASGARLPTFAHALFPRGGVSIDRTHQLPRPLISHSTRQLHATAPYISHAQPASVPSSAHLYHPSHTDRHTHATVTINF